MYVLLLTRTVTVKVPDALWEEFSIAVIRTRGARAKNKVLVELIQKFVKNAKEAKASELFV
jgi:hypothetical protein